MIRRVLLLSWFATSAFAAESFVLQKSSHVYLWPDHPSLTRRHSAICSSPRAFLHDTRISTLRIADSDPLASWARQAGETPAFELTLRAGIRGALVRPNEFRGATALRRVREAMGVLRGKELLVFPELLGKPEQLQSNPHGGFSPGAKVFVPDPDAISEVRCIPAHGIAHETLGAIPLVDLRRSDAFFSLLNAWKRKKSLVLGFAQHFCRDRISCGNGVFQGNMLSKDATLLVASLGLLDEAEKASSNRFLIGPDSGRVPRCKAFQVRAFPDFPSRGWFVRECFEAALETLAGLPADRGWRSELGEMTPGEIAFLLHQIGFLPHENHLSHKHIIDAMSGQMTLSGITARIRNLLDHLRLHLEKEEHWSVLSNAPALRK